MSNTSISSNLGSTIIQGVQQGNSAESATNVPPGILALPSGTLLKGKVIDLHIGHHAVLQTPKGDILIKTDLPIQRGNEIVLRLETSSSGVRARIISVDGRTPSELGQGTRANFSPLDIPTLNSPLSSSLKPSPAPVDIQLTGALPLRAILVTPSNGFDQLVERLNSFVIPRSFGESGGGNFIIKLLPQSLRLPAPLANAPQNVLDAIDGKSANTAVQPGSSPSLAAQNRTQTGYSNTISTANAAPNMPAPAAASLAEGQLAAKVIGTEQSGQAVLKTVMGTLKIDLPHLANGRPVALPAGTELTIQLLPANPNHFSNNPVAIASNAPAGVLELSHHWHGIHQLFDVTQNISPALAEQLTQNTIPSPGPKMAATILFFISALRGGSMQQWLGRQTVERLEQAGHSGLTKRLSSEFGSLRQLFTDPPSQNWKAVFIPVQHELGWQQMRLFLRREPEDGKNEQKGKVSRFIVELDLSQFGSIQLDGFVKLQTPKKSFDLVVRSYDSLPKANQDDIQNIFYTAAEVTGFHGNINFQTNQPFPIHPMEEIVARHPNMIV